MFARSNHSGALVVLALAIVLSGCGNNNFDTSGSWFAKPLNLFGQNLGYTYTDLGYSRQDRGITANDLVAANGACPAPAAPGPTQSAAGNPAASPAAASDTASLLGGGIAIGMSECDVVARVGPPAAVNLGNNPNGDRTSVLTFKSGPRPGVYRFVGGRLTEMDRVDEPAPPPPPAKKKAEKKKPATTQKQQKPEDKT